MNVGALHEGNLEGMAKAVVGSKPPHILISKVGTLHIQSVAWKESDEMRQSKCATRMNPKILISHGCLLKVKRATLNTSCD